jgi:spermidine synthase
MLETATTPDGGALTLYREEGDLTIRIDGLGLMSSRMHGSESAMARVACEALRHVERPRVLVGGLGLGYTLRAVLDRLPPGGEVICTELMPAIAEWHRGILGALAEHPLDDPRARLVIGDVVAWIADHPEGAPPDLDAILLDIDNGPIPLTVIGNWWLYAHEGLRALLRRLRPGGVLVVWSSMEDRRFAARMQAAGFETHTRRVLARNGRRARRTWRGRPGRRLAHHVLFVGTPLQEW